MMLQLCFPVVADNMKKYKQAKRKIDERHE